MPLLFMSLCLVSLPEKESRRQRRGHPGLTTETLNHCQLYYPGSEMSWGMGALSSKFEIKSTNETL